EDLLALRDWLKACAVTTVALESTSVYWIPVFQILEAAGLQVVLVNARRAKTGRPQGPPHQSFARRHRQKPARRLAARTPLCPAPELRAVAKTPGPHHRLGRTDRRPARRLRHPRGPRRHPCARQNQPQKTAEERAAIPGPGGMLSHPGRGPHGCAWVPNPHRARAPV